MCNRTIVNSFLNSISVGGGGNILVPSLICNASAGEEYRSVFKPAAIIGSGGFGTVWLYRKETGPAAGHRRGVPEGDNP